MAEPQVRQFARRSIERGLRKLVRSARPALESARDEDLHSTRIAVKRLRYNLEFYASTLGDSCRQALDLLSLAQERLGTVADADAFVRFYDDLSDHLGENDLRRTGIAARREAALAERDRAIKSLRALWKGEDGAPYPESLAGSISSALGSLSPNEES